jgi:protein TonB
MSNNAKNSARAMPLSSAFLIALTIESAVLILGAVAIANANNTPTPEPTMVLRFEEPTPEKIVKPAPVPVPVPNKPTPVAVKHNSSPAPKEPVVLPTPPAPAVANSPIAEPVPTPPAPPPPIVNNEAAEKETSFAAQLKAAIQAALIYPPAARMMAARGKVRLAFIFKDGIFSKIDIVQSSGNNLLDQAATAAVSHADVPPIPESIKGKNMPYLITLNFDILK